MKATLQAWNDFDCRKIPGYVGAIRKGNFLAVLGRSEWAAIRASRTIETTWSDWQGLPEQPKLWEYVRKVKVNMIPAGERLYVVSNKGMEEESVQARSVKDGKVLWTARLGGVGIRPAKVELLLPILLGLSTERG